MKHDIQSEILSRNLSSFLKLRTHSQHLKMDVHNWCPIFPCLLLSTFCCDIKASIQSSHFLSFHCLSVKLWNALVAKNYLIWSLLVVKGLKSSLFYHSRVRRAKLIVGEECQLIYRQVVSCYVRSFSYARKQTKHQRQNSLFEDLVSLREDALFSLFPGELPIFLILLSRTFHLRRSLC